MSLPPNVIPVPTTEQAYKRGSKAKVKTRPKAKAKSPKATAVALARRREGVYQTELPPGVERYYLHGDYSPKAHCYYCQPCDAFVAYDHFDDCDLLRRTYNQKVGKYWVSAIETHTKRYLDCCDRNKSNPRVILDKKNMFRNWVTDAVVSGELRKSWKKALMHEMHLFTVPTAQELRAMQDARHSAKAESSRILDISGAI